MSGLTVYIDGIGLWLPPLSGFENLRRVLAGEAVASPAARPAAAALPANERRRAPENVLLAAEVAGQAVAMSARDPGALACVFSSSHGDQSITDYMCATLAVAPTELSPTRFHNSVHNAPAGYWTMAAHCHAASTAVSAHHESFGAALLEAAAQVLTERQALLLVCSDVAGSGPLGQVTGCESAFGCALVLSPVATLHTLGRLDLNLMAGNACPPPLPAPLDHWRRSSPSAAALDLLAVLAQGEGECAVAVAPTLQFNARVVAEVAA